MSTMAQTTGLLEVSLPSRTVKLLGGITPRIKLLYCNWMEARARKRVFELRGELTPDEYNESMRAVASASAAGTFSWGGEAFLASVRQLPGNCKLTHLLLTEADRLHHAGNNISEEELYSLLQDRTPIAADEVEEAEQLTTAKVLNTAVRQVCDSSPNFLAPPPPGEAAS